MKAFHNDPKVKAKYLTRVEAHRKADEIIKGSYWSVDTRTESGKGCAVGCTIHGSDHSAYERELGIPTWLARVEDTLFEGMSVEKSKTWPGLFLKAIKPGADLEKAKPKFLLMVLKSALGSFDHEKNPRVKAAVLGSIALWKRKDIGSPEWKKDAAAYTAADAAAYAAAYTAAYAAADAAAAAAAYAAAYTAAAAAAYAAAAAAAAAAARRKKFDKFADGLLKILKECK